MRYSFALPLANVALLLSLSVPAALGQVPDSLAPPLSLPVVNFDFWVGEWDVNLRTKQPDFSWQDARTANAKIYSVLRGKAVLELWDEVDIKGFSIRYFDPDRNAWVLWLNWPGENRSGSSSLEGRFRHGRGEFFSAYTNADGEDVIQRYTFSDISPTTLRWDDAYSSDGGASWSHNWIMEFTRTANAPRFKREGGPAHTFATGSRCDGPQFRAYEFLTGPWVGVMEAGGRGPIAVTGYRILDGCAVLLFAGVQGRAESATRFGHLTWNTGKGQYEMLRLASDSAAKADLFLGEATDDGFVLYDHEAHASAERRIRVARVERENILWIEETRAGDDWSAVWGARVDRFVPGRF